MAKATKNAAKVGKATSKSKATTKAVEVVNPFREGGGYWATVEAFKTLQLETLHPFETIIPAVKAAFGLGWAEFKNKDARNENGKDAEARIVQNVGVVARKDYGLPLRLNGWEVRFDGRQKVAGLFRCPKPTLAEAKKPFADPKKPEPKQAAKKPEAKKKAAPAQKASKPKPPTGKGKAKKAA